MNRAAATIRVHVEEALFENLKEAADLPFVVLIPLRLILPAEHSDEIPADLNNGAAEGIGLIVVSFSFGRNNTVNHVPRSRAVWPGESSV